jgi:hypothetical protein
VVDQEPSGEADGDVLDGKHARVFTAAAAKRNPALPEKSEAAVTRWVDFVFAFPPPQFLDQALELGCRTHEIRPQALLEPFAHGVTDRSARLAIDFLACMGFKAGHGRFRRQFVFGSGSLFQTHLHRNSFRERGPCMAFG